MDLVVRPMESFCSMDLVVVLWKIFFFPWTWLLSYGRFFWSHGLGCRPMKDFLFHGLGCRPMEDFFCSMDLIVVSWRNLFLFVTIDLVVVLWMHICFFFVFPWTWLLSYGKFLDLIKSWESSRRLNFIVSLLIAISLPICLIAFCFFLL
jgi:hypothetical protein